MSATSKQHELSNLAQSKKVKKCKNKNAKAKTTRIIVAASYLICGRGIKAGKYRWLTKCLKASVVPLCWHLTPTSTFNSMRSHSLSLTLFLSVSRDVFVLSIRSVSRTQKNP